MNKSLRNILIVCTLILIPLGIWVGSICTSVVQSYQQDRVLSGQLIRLANASSIIAQQQSHLVKIEELERNLHPVKRRMDEPTFFLNYIDSLAQSLSLTILDFPHEDTLSVQSYKILEGHMKIEGGYLDVVKYIHQIEIVDRVGVVTQLDLERKDVRQISESSSLLFVDITFQRLLFSP